MKSQKRLQNGLWAMLVWLASSAAALGQTAPAPDIAMTGPGESPVLPGSETTIDRPQAAGGEVSFAPPCCPRWTASAEFIILDRVGTVPYTLVERVHALSPRDPGTEIVNSDDLRPGFRGGPRLGLTYHGDDGNAWEVSYFQIDGWDSSRSVGPTPDDWLVMEAPGNFVQFQNDALTQRMVWDYGSRLYNAELNRRWNGWDRVTLLAGLRWVNLSEDLEGILLPPTAHGTGSFWNTQTKNNLFGLQIGADAKLFERDRFSIDSVLKAGLFVNHAEETTTVRMERIQFPESDLTDHGAFLGEIDLRCKYRVTQRLSLKAGYEVMWLNGVALAPGQISKTYCHGTLLPEDTYVRSLGVNCSSGVFYHGATAGIEYSF